MDGDGGGDGDFVSEDGCCVSLPSSEAVSSDKPWQPAQPAHSRREHMECCSDVEMPDEKVHEDAQPDASSAVVVGGDGGMIESELKWVGGDGGGGGSRS